MASGVIGQEPIGKFLDLVTCSADDEKNRAFVCVLSIKFEIHCWGNEVNFQKNILHEETTETLFNFVSAIDSKIEKVSGTITKGKVHFRNFGQNRRVSEIFY